MTYMTESDVQGELIRELTLAFRSSNPHQAIADAAIRAAGDGKRELLVRLGEVHRSPELEAILFSLLHERDPQATLALLDDALLQGSAIATELALFHTALAWGAL